MFRISSSSPVGPRCARVCAYFVALLAVFALAAGVARAQLAGTGAISGTVQDPTGAVVASATVTVTNVDTNVSTTRTTTRAGDYNISDLISGTYTVTVAASGFQGYKQENVTVDALNTVAVNVKLSVGQASETVTVTTAPPLLETTDATLGGVMDSQMYSNLPVQMGAGSKLDQRRVTDFASLMPGVQSNESGNDPTDNTGIVNGSGPGGNVQDLYIEGIDLPVADGNGDPRGTWTAISVDSVNQFQVQTAGVSSQYAGQGMQNYSIKSGGNGIHGSLYEFNRNTLFDAWAFAAKIPTINAQGKTIPGGIKTREVQNEFGIDLSGPIIKNKLFLFANYGQYRYQLGAKPAPMSIPTAAMLGMTQSGTALGYADYTAFAQANGASACASTASEGTGGTPIPANGCEDIYDPITETLLCNGTTIKCGRTLFHGMLNGVDQNDVIPGSRLSQAATYINQFWVPYEKLAQQNLYTNNLDYGIPIGLANWYQTARIDYNENAKNQVALIVAFGRQASTGPNSVSGLGPPFNSSQSYHPVTQLSVLKDTYTINAHLVNQLSFGYVRYQSVSVTPDDAPPYTAAAIGLLGTPPGQASSGFPEITGVGPQQGGYAWNAKTSNTYTATDTLQWEFGQHNITLGGQYVAEEFNIYKALGPTGPMNYGFSGNQTAGFQASGANSLLSGTGNSVASYMIGAVSSEAVLDPFIPGTGSREHDPSFWAQDDYKVNNKLTLNLGLRWDIFTPYSIAHNLLTFFNPNGNNSITGNKGTLYFAGNGDPAQYCNCTSPISTYYGNIGPRLGMAYAVDPKTVIRGSFDVNYARGNAEGGSQTGSPQTTGLTPSGTSPTVPTPDFPIIYWDATACTKGTNAGVNCGFNGSINAPAVPTDGTSLAEYGTGNNSTTSSSATTMDYFDKYKGARTPQFENWSFGLQRQITRDISLSVSYVGSQGHFVGGGFSPLNHRNTLPTSFLALAGYTVTGTTDAPCSGLTCTTPLIGTKYSAANLALFQAAGFTPPNPYTSGVTYTTSNSTTGYFDPYPELGESDQTNFNGNTSFHALEVTLRGRQSHGVDFMLNYTYSKSMDDVGSFRLVDNPRLDRSLSTADQPQNLTASVVYSSPYGKGRMASSNFLVRGLASGWILSGIYTYHSGAPIAFTGSGCAGTPLGTCMPSIVPGVNNVHNISYANPPGGVVAATGYANSYSAVHHFDPTAFTVLDYSNSAVTTINNCQLLGPGACTGPAGSGYVGGESPSAYVVGNAARVGADNVWGMGLYDLDMALKRSFPIWESVSLQFEVDVYNATNHVVFGAPGGVVGSGSMGTVGANDSFSGTSTYGVLSSVSNQQRDFQLSGRINW